MKEVIKLGSQEIVLDRDAMNFDENTLNSYLMREGGLYDYFGQKFAEFEYYLELASIEYDAKYSELFTKIKEDQGGSDNLVKSKCESNPELIAFKRKMADIKKSVTKLKQHLKAWDKNHDNAQSFGHTLRREMDKLFTDIRSKDYNLSEKAEEIVSGSNI